MTTQEKELVKLMCEQSCLTYCDEEIHDHIELAKAIIAKYPQILAEKVWEGETYMLQQSSADGVNYFEYIYSTNGVPKNIEVFIREVK